jgi:hypothetical protein
MLGQRMPRHTSTLPVAALLAFAVLGLAKAPAPQAIQDRAKPQPGSDRRPEAAEVWTDHLKVSAYPSQAAIMPGRPLSLIVEIEPQPRMHVYAPGDHDYRVITLTVAPQPSVRLMPIEYPASEIYLFEPLDERVPVYQKPFRLVQQVALEKPLQTTGGKPSTLTFTGTLDYQACDDRICFNPVSVPLSWKVALQPGVVETPGRR